MQEAAAATAAAAETPAGAKGDGRVGEDAKFAERDAGTDR